jgi:hypothetical protein
MDLPVRNGKIAVKLLKCRTLLGLLMIIAGVLKIEMPD